VTPRADDASSASDRMVHRSRARRCRGNVALKDGVPIFTGPFKDNREGGQRQDFRSLRFKSLGDHYLVEGVVGSVT
jgi:hypothetical protein